MSVANAQIDELLKVLHRHVGPHGAGVLLRDLARTEAYRRNASFRETVDRLLAEDARKP